LSSHRERWFSGYLGEEVGVEIYSRCILSDLAQDPDATGSSWLLLKQSSDMPGMYLIKIILGKNEG
jgi:hypothetical protein